jgi:mannose-6-phosphate isomerase-like protein (cupin superfamily)
MPSIEKVNLQDKFGRFTDRWSPKVVAEINDCLVKLVKVQGEFTWHHHDVEDELFFVVKGTLVIRLRDGEVRLGEGEMVVIPHGVEHLPVAEEEVWLMLVEPGTTLNTGTVRNERTVADLKRI